MRALSGLALGNLIAYSHAKCPLVLFLWSRLRARYITVTVITGRFTVLISIRQSKGTVCFTILIKSLTINELLHAATV